MGSQYVYRPSREKLLPVGKCRLGIGRLLNRCASESVSALFISYRTINGNRARTFDQHDDCQRYRQEMVLKSLTLLLAGPVHEETIDVMDGGDGDQHVDDDAQRGDTAEQTNQQSEATEEFGANCQECQRRRNSHCWVKNPIVPWKP